MNFYLSSYRLGDKKDQLRVLAPSDRIGYIPNALDFTSRNAERAALHIVKDRDMIDACGFQSELLDLKDYFGKQDALRKKLDKLQAVFVSGGNTFVLRQAMKLSGFDDMLIEKATRGDNFLYAGYSAGVCVLAPRMEALQIVDDPNDFPYEGITETIWEGLGVVPYMVLPHYDSDHPESADIDKEVAYCLDKGIVFRTLRDGEVIVIEN